MKKKNSCDLKLRRKNERNVKLLKNLRDANTHLDIVDFVEPKMQNTFLLKICICVEIVFMGCLNSKLNYVYINNI